jgi:hypothetical protein
MPDTIVSWLDGVGATAFTLSAIAFVAVNAIAVAAVVMTRDRGLVNRWTPHFLAANLLLLGTGLGVPLAALAARSVITAVTPSFHQDASSDGPGRAEAGPASVTR